MHDGARWEGGSGVLAGCMSWAIACIWLTAASARLSKTYQLAFERAENMPPGGDASYLFSTTAPSHVYFALCVQVDVCMVFVSEVGQDGVLQPAPGSSHGARV